MFGMLTSARMLRPDVKLPMFAMGIFISIITLVFVLNGVNAAGVTILAPDSGISVRVDENNGAYEVELKNPTWSFGGEIQHPLNRTTVGAGEDSVGHYKRISFEWVEDLSAMSGEIRLYTDKPLILFSDTRKIAGEMPPPPFPLFTKLPEKLHVFSYQEEAFAPPQFSANDCSTPWLLFDDQANALVISPASHFMVASMLGDARQRIASGFNNRLRNVPAGFSQQTILAFGSGINRTWDVWGQSLRALEGVRQPHNDADAILKYLGYWTDNGAYYYYNFDLEKGYDGTLKLLAADYRQNQIPIRYLQLDSWWYYKTFTDPAGVVGGAKSARLPQGEWNRYGGLLEYKAHPDVFPKGLEAFQKSVGLPLVTHNRWIDPASLYHQKYEISGVAALDPKWWGDITTYLKTSGVKTYEQDWLNVIYEYSPAFGSNFDTAETFLNNMASACKDKGITMQYCMAYPCYFLQGSRYDNLTTIRTSGDRFLRDQWNHFLYTSRLAYSMGIRPWTDVFKSTETNNLLLSTLSSGPVGIGDAIGQEDKNNIFKAIRADGVIVKPDVPAMPLDCSYLADAQGKSSPLVAGTFTDHSGIKTEYLFAFNDSTAQTNEVRFTPIELGLAGPVYIYDYFSKSGKRLESTATFSTPLKNSAVAFFIVAPIGKSGIAFLGDNGMFVSTGKERIASLSERASEMDADVLFASTEKSIILHGYSAVAPEVRVKSGVAGPLQFNMATRHFLVEISPDSAVPLDTSGADPVRHVMVTLRTSKEMKAK